MVVHDETEGCGSVQFHTGWNLGGFSELAGRVTDLRSAYKQLPLHKDSRRFCVISCVNPTTGKAELFVPSALMFGQTAAVYAFLRFSRALSTIAAKVLKLTTVEFFDDFTQLEPKATSNSAHESFEGLLRLLGWEVAMEDRKRKPFADRFVSLGALVDLSMISKGRVIIENKLGRVDDIVALAEQIRSQDPLRAPLLLSLRGKVLYAEGQLFNKISAVVCGLIASRVKNGGTRDGDEVLGSEIDRMCHALAAASPRVLERRSSVRPVLVFTDGACEDLTTIGRYALFPDGATEMFGAVVPRELEEQWRSRSGQAQVIGQAELFPLLVARLTWKEQMRGQRVVFFIDNESARLAAIKSYSPVLSSTRILADIFLFDHVHEVYPWYARVPTFSNISDGPSRFVDPSVALPRVDKVVYPIFTFPFKPARVLEQGRQSGHV